MADCRAGECSLGPFLPPDPRHSVHLRRLRPQPRYGEGRSGGTVQEMVAQRLVEDNGSLWSEDRHQNGISISSSRRKGKDFISLNRR